MRNYSVVYAFLFSFLVGCATLPQVYMSGLRNQKIRQIDVFVISQDIKIQNQFDMPCEANCVGRVTKMAPWISPFSKVLEMALVVPYFMHPKGAIENSMVAPQVRFEELRGIFGSNFVLNDKTNTFSSREAFLSSNGNSDNLKLIFHVCQLSNFPMDGHVRGNSYNRYKVDTTAIKIEIYERKRRKFLYFNNFAPEILEENGTTGTMTNQEFSKFIYSKEVKMALDGYFEEKNPIRNNGSRATE